MLAPFVPAEPTSKRHLVPSLLLAFALVLLGLQADGSKAPPSGSDRAVFQQAQTQVLAARSVESKPGVRRVQQPLVPHLVCPPTQVLVREVRVCFLSALQAMEIAGCTIQRGNLRGRASQA
jgi:hypothetical protein